MTASAISGVRISALAASVPQKILSNENDVNIDENERSILIRTTGVRQRRVVSAGVTTVDLCDIAARNIFQDREIDPKSIDVIVFVSQSGDYYLPASSIILQDRLGLRHDVMAFDVGLGCSGYVYGLSIVSGLMKSFGLRRGMLLAGDVSSLSCAVTDKSTYPIFGDAGSATLLDLDAGSPSMMFNFQTDGSGFESIIIPDGGARNRISTGSFSVLPVSPGVSRSRMHLALDGMAVFSFATARVPASIKELLSEASLSPSEVDYLIMHQANLLMNEAIRKKSGFSAEQSLYSLEKFGNTSSASIPLTVVTKLSGMPFDHDVSVLFSGFGVGLSWANALVRLQGVRCIPLIEVSDDGRQV